MAIRNVAQFALVLALSASVTDAHAQASSSPSAASAPIPAPAPAPATAPATAGITVILASVLAGAALTVYGLTIDCSDTDHSCHRRASLPIWGGLGVASVGSIVGLGLLQSGDGTSVAALSLGGRF